MKQKKNKKVIVVLNKSNIICFCVFFCLGFIQCQTNKLPSVTLLKSELRKENQLFINKTYTNNNIQYKVPKFKKTVFNKIIEDYNSTFIKDDYCTGEGNISIDIRVFTAKEKILSFIRRIYISGCGYPSDVIYSESANYMLVGNDFYNVRLKKEYLTEEATIRAVKKLVKNDDECLSLLDENGVSGNLILKKDKAELVNPLDERFCLGSIPIEFNDKIFEFKKLLMTKK